MMSRLPARENELVDRSREIHLTFRGRRISAFPGETIGSALYASGQRIFSRSFKYHRPRGLLCCTGHCANCQMTVDGIPNVRVCVEPARDGAVVEPQNFVGSLERDLMQITDKIGGPFTPPGFYYKTFIRPRRLWPLYEKVLRRAAGLGRLDPQGARRERVDGEHRHVDVVVVGGGRSGLAAATEAARGGRSVILVEEGPEPGGRLLAARDGVAEARRLAADAREAGVEILSPATAIGVFEQGLVPVAHGNLLLKIRAHDVVVASGAAEQPLVFPGNDLVGVMLTGAARRLAHLYGVVPGKRAVVLTVDEEGVDAAADLKAAGVEVVEVVDFRATPPSYLAAHGRKGHVRGVQVDTRSLACDLVVVSGARQPVTKLLSQAGARVEFDAARGVFVPRDLPAHVTAVGSVTGAGAGDAVAIPEPAYAGHGDKCFVCICEDQTLKDLQYAIDEGYDSIELSKRYTTVTMGPCQGRLCHTPSVRCVARTRKLDEDTIGTTTARPPHTPVSMGLLAGRPHEPAKRTSLHHRHEDLGGRMMWTGAWRRPHSYGPDAGAEAQNVHEHVGLIDVSTLGKILVQGPEAGAFLDLIYPNRFSDLKRGRVRYGVITGDAGRIMDDGTVARLDDETYYVTTSSTGADGVYQWLTWWNAVWHRDVRFANLTGALAAINVAGPRARELMTRVSADDYAKEAIAYLDARDVTVAGVPSLALRIGFVGELGYELHLPSCHAQHVWDALLENGADLGVTPFGLEPQRILRLEKGHIIVGQDTDSESNLLEAAMPWIYKDDKPEAFVGKWATAQIRDRGLRWMLVGFESPTGAIPVEGGQVVVDGRSSGRVTSVRFSQELGKVIGLAIVPHAMAVDGGRFDVQIDGRPHPMTVHLAPFFDPSGERLKA